MKPTTSLICHAALHGANSATAATEWHQHLLLKMLASPFMHMEHELIDPLLMPCRALVRATVK